VCVSIVCARARACVCVCCKNEYLKILSISRSTVFNAQFEDCKNVFKIYIEIYLGIKI